MVPQDQFHFVDLSVVNAFVLWRHCQIAAGNQTRLPSYKFKIQVALALMSCSDNEPRRFDFDEDVGRRVDVRGDPFGDASVSEHKRYDGVDHLPENVAEKPRRCKLEGCKKASTIWCKKCCAYLCIKKGDGCFIKFHTR